MCRVRSSQRNSRRASALLETAVVMVPLMMFFCGVFEYGRFLMILNLFNNATREGCRYALANNTASTISTDVKNIVTTQMAGQGGAITSLNVAVTGTHNGTATAVNSLVPGDYITVTVTANYKFMNIIPLVPMPNTVSLSSAVTMVCEGGL